MDENMTDNVNSPSHYARYRFECEPKDLTKFLPHPLASAIEYIIRAPFKGSELEDLKKARFWLLEFVNTTEFWVRVYENKGPDFCNLLNYTSVNFKMRATAYAICSQCDYLNAAFLCLKGPNDFPRVIFKHQVEYLIENLNARINNLSSKPSE